jgi:hypothetical protein
MGKDQKSVEALREEYVSLSEQWVSLPNARHRMKNKVFVEHHGVSKRLRATERGRAGLLQLVNQDSDVVRLQAAVDCLAFAPEVGIPALEAIELPETNRYSFDAKWTLKTFRDGTLNLDW